MTQLRLAPSGELIEGGQNHDLLVWDEALQQWFPEEFTGLLPGAPIYDVMAPPFNASGNGVGDDTAALNAAIAAANAVPGTIVLGPIHLVEAAQLDIVTGNNVIIQGRGRYNGGSVIRFASSTPPTSGWLRFHGQYSGIQDTWITGYGLAHTTGAAIVFANFQGIARRLLITGCAIGIQNISSTLLKVDETTIQGTFGPYGIHVGGNPTTGTAHATWINNCLFSNTFPLAVTSTGTWAPSTAYSVGNVVINGGQIYQCATAGTSAPAGGPTGLPPGATVFDVQSLLITDGTVSWRWCMPVNEWIVQDSYSHTCRVMDCAFLQGGRAIVMRNTEGLGNFPQFFRGLNIEIDHCVVTGISLEAGQQAEFEQTFITSMYTGRAIDKLSTHGGARFNGGWLFAGPIELARMAGNDWSFTDFFIGGAGLSASNTFDAIAVQASSTRWKITDCQIGSIPGDTVPDSRYGISIAASCDNYLVEDNLILGNLTAPILNTPGVAITRVVRNNVPDNGMRWGGVQNFTLDTGANPHTIAINEGVTFVYINITGAGDLVLQAITYGNSNSGARVLLAKNTGTANGLILRNNGTLGANQITPPSNADYRLRGSLSAVEVSHNSFSWVLGNRSNPSAAVVVAVPVVASATLAYLDVVMTGTVLEGIAANTPIIANPRADLAAAALNAGFFVGCRVSATNTVRFTFFGALAGGNTTFDITMVP